MHLIQLPEIIPEVIAIVIIISKQLQLSLNFFHIKIHVLTFLLLDHRFVFHKLFPSLIVIHTPFAWLRLWHRVLLTRDAGLAMAHTDTLSLAIKPVIALIIYTH